MNPIETHGQENKQNNPDLSDVPGFPKAHQVSPLMKSRRLHRWKAVFMKTGDSRKPLPSVLERRLPNRLKRAYYDISVFGYFLMVSISIALVWSIGIFGVKILESLNSLF